MTCAGIHDSGRTVERGARTGAGRVFSFACGGRVAVRRCATGSGALGAAPGRVS
jgi:hypothetical protein